MRLPTGGLIDRTRPLRFRFEGRLYEGYAGDTLASALLANGIRVLGRSFKYHRPRGLLAAGAEEPNALMRLGEGAATAVNLRATEIVLHDGLIAAPVNCWPSVRFDVGALSGAFSRFIGAGFYYKTFMWPHWHLYERSIRRAAGLGKPSADPDPDRYDSVHAHCDVLVVGGGAAGLAAAQGAACSGARVILAEQDFVLGGRLLWDEATIGGLPGREWAKRAAQQISSSPEARILTGTTAVGYFDHNAIVLTERCASGSPDGGPRERMWQIRAKRVLLATGAIERPLVFCGNDRPGVMLAQAVRHYLRRYAVRPGKRAIVMTNNDDAYRTALALSDAGVEVACVCDSREKPPAQPAAALSERGIEVLSSAMIVGTEGGSGLRAVRLRAAGRVRRVACDLLAMSGGENPSIQLFTQSGGKPVYDATRQCFVPGASVQAETSVGAAAGEFSLRASLRAGHAAGIAAAGSCGFAESQQRVPPESDDTGPSEPTVPQWGPGLGQPKHSGKCFVDFQNDVTLADIELSARENLVSVEHLKRYTTLGMAIDQGKTSNVNALALMAQITGRSIAQTGTTRNRFPYTPVTIGSFGGLSRGDCFRPFRRLALHEWHLTHGAALEEYGGWMRPAHYRRGVETAHAAAQREALAVREAVGIFDSSPLGKIEVRGRDAARFLDRIYANTISTMQPGKARYGLMLNELGVITDDGIVSRFSQDHFLVGTTSAGAARVAAWLEEWLQCEWRDLDVLTAPVTSSWAVLTITGPRARDVLAGAGADVELGPENFPHMSFRQGSLGGVPARIFRVSFTGEASYEINVPTGEARRVWDKLMSVGEAHGITPVGIDAWMLLRTEKGYFHVGGDTDGTTVPADVGWERVIRKPGDFVGKRSLSLEGNCRSDRLQLVGLEPSAGETLPVGAHLSCRPRKAGSEGYVTSSGFSPALRRGVALAMVRGGRARLGESIDVIVDGSRVAEARISQACAYDPDGARLHA
jgi:sarcosine oxidase subunit alpha